MIKVPDDVIISVLGRGIPCVEALDGTDFLFFLSISVSLELYAELIRSFWVCYRIERWN